MMPAPDAGPWERLRRWFSGLGQGTGDGADAAGAVPAHEAEPDAAEASAGPDAGHGGGDGAAGDAGGGDGGGGD